MTTTGLWRYVGSMRYGCIALGVLLASTSLVAQQRVENAPDVSVTIRMRVCDAKGEPIESAGVVVGVLGEVTTAKALTDPDARSAADGTILFVAKIPPLSHTQVSSLLVAARGKTAVRYSHPFYSIFPELKVKTHLDLGELRLDDGHTLSGRIRDEQGKPMAGARIRSQDGFVNGSWMKTSFGSEALSNARGVFTLPGVFASAMNLRIEADGYYTHFFGSVDLGSPLDVRLRPSGFVEGQVVDELGQPLEGAVMISHEFGDATDGYPSTAGGRFRIGVSKPGRFRVTAYDNYRGVIAQSELLDGPAEGVEVRRENGQPKGGFVIRAVDAVTKKAIPEIRGAVLWLGARFWLGGDDKINDDLKAVLRIMARPSHEDGRLSLQGPSKDDDLGAVHVVAAGYAPAFNAEVAFQAGKDVVIELTRSAAIRGKVLDAASGDPVAGARVTCELRGKKPPGSSPRATEIFVVTGRDGRYEFSDLSAGSYQVLARWSTGTANATLLVRVKTSEQVADADVALPRGVTVTGKVSGAKLPLGCKVLLVGKGGGPRRSDHWLTRARMLQDGSARHQEAVPLHEGSFSLPHRAAATEKLLLLIPGGLRQGAAIAVWVARARIGEADLDLAVDLAEHAPGTITGVIKVKGVKAPAARFVVVAKRAPRHGDHVLPEELCGSRWSLVDSTGRYSIALAPGEYTLEVVDSATGITLAKVEEPCEVAALDQAVVDQSVDVVEIRARFTMHEGRSPSASHVAIAASQDNVPDFTMALFGNGAHENPGFGIIGVSQPVRFFVPPGPVDLKVKGGATRIHRGMTESTDEYVLERSFDAEFGKVGEWLIELPPPVDMKSEQPK